MANTLYDYARQRFLKRKLTGCQTLSKSFWWILVRTRPTQPRTNICLTFQALRVLLVPSYAHKQSNNGRRSGCGRLHVYSGFRRVD